MTVLALVLAAGVCAALPADGRGRRREYRKDFLYRSGTQLMLNGKPYRCASFNSFQMSGCGNDYELFSLEQIDSVFALLPPNMLVRTWAFPGNGERIGKVIGLAERHHVKLILSLGDGRSSCGHFDGAPDGDNSGKVPEWYEGGFRREYLPHVVAMTSKYKDSPAIGMWEIINEPGDADWRTIKAFLDEVAAVIKRHDPNHLVESGTFPIWAYGGTENYRAMHESPNIDVGNIHEYDYDYEGSNQIESPHFMPCMEVMQELGKVLLVGETGIESGDGCRTDRSTRVEAMKRKFDIYLSKGAGAVMVWNLVRIYPDCGFSFPLSDPLFGMIVSYPVNQTNE